jgi:uncharacterized protein YkwD
LRLAAAATLLACVPALAEAAPSPGHPGAARAAARSQADVNARYWSEWGDLVGVPSGWTGSVSPCSVGTNSAAATSAALRAINFGRWLNGLSPVVLDSTLNQRALAAALIMQANNTLTHTPAEGSTCWSSAGADAARHGNVAFRTPSLTPVQAIAVFYADASPGMTMTPHRRWLLNPSTAKMGVGTTSQFSAAYVIGHTGSGRANPAYVRWPAAGWFPGTLAPGRWSLGGPGLRFGKAKISVYRGGTRLATHKQRVVGGYGQPTVVWTMPSGYAKTGPYKVVVKGLHRTGRKKAFSTSWTVRLFAPRQ